FGARYLDPRFSKWMSTDPALGGYLSKRQVDPRNFAVYSYAYNGPLVHTDSNGLEVQELTTGRLNQMLFAYGYDPITRSSPYLDLFKATPNEYYKQRGYLFEEAMVNSLGVATTSTLERTLRSPEREWYTRYNREV